MDDTYIRIRDVKLSAVLCVILLLVYLVLSPSSFSLFAIAERMNDGHIGESSGFGMYSDPKYYPPRFPWRGNDIQKVRALLKEMKYHSKDHDVLVAPEFGVALDAGYFPFIDQEFFNPVIVNQSEKHSFECTNRIGDKTIHKRIPEWIKLAFTNIQGERITRVFDKRDVCKAHIPFEFEAGWISLVRQIVSK